MLLPEDVFTVLVGFMSEMKAWEESFLAEKIDLVNRGKSTSACNLKYQKSFKSIFDKYVSGDSKTTARLELPGARSPTMYDFDRDIVEKPEVKGSKATIRVAQVDGFESVFKFTMGEVDGRCMILRKDTLRGGKWERSSL